MENDRSKTLCIPTEQTTINHIKLIKYIYQLKYHTSLILLQMCYIKTSNYLSIMQSSEYAKTYKLIRAFLFQAFIPKFCRLFPLLMEYI